MTDSHTLHGDDLAWLELMLTGRQPGRYDDVPGGPQLVVARGAAGPGTTLHLLDPEGVTLARLPVEAVTPGPTGDLLSGTPEAGTAFAHPDHVDLRRLPSEVNLPGSLAVWGDIPSPLAFRRAAAEHAERTGQTVLEFLGVPTGAETDPAVHGSVRLARRHTTRRAGDALVVVPWPGLGWDETGLRARAHVVAAYGCTTLAVPVGVDPVTAGRVETATGVRLVDLDVPPDRARVTPARLAELLAGGDPVPGWLAEPPVAGTLQALHRPRSEGGLTVLLSGLSGSGKSTVARALAVRLIERETRSVSLLDGDVVRHHLSKGLGFSRADRDLNVRRIGFVASEITRAGGIVVCAPIAPYDGTRRAVRAMVEAYGGFVLVHVATPLAECERRDRKGLYARARAGEIPEFTGISDPYDVPADAEVTIDTTGRPVDECVTDVMDALERLGYLTSVPPPDTPVLG
jgi:sulfate adenylyltransferase